MPGARYTPATGPATVCGVFLQTGAKGLATRIEALYWTGGDALINQMSSHAAMGEVDPTNPESVQEALSGGLFEPQTTPEQQAAVDDIVAHAPRLKVGLVQPNFAYSMDGEFSRDEALRQLTALQEQSRRLEQQGAQLLVWSEGSFPIAVPREFSVSWPVRIRRLVSRRRSR